MHKTKRFFCTILVGTLAVTSVFGGWEKGEKLPDLEAFGLEGDLPDLDGKVTYVDFWASWCPPCRAAFPEIERIYLENQDAGFRVVAVSLDSTEKAMQKFVERVKPSFPIVRDADQSLAGDAGIEVMPTSFLVDRKGVIRAVHFGWSGGSTAAELEAEIKDLLEESDS